MVTAADPAGDGVRDHDSCAWDGHPRRPRRALAPAAAMPEVEGQNQPAAVGVGRVGSRSAAADRARESHPAAAASPGPAEAEPWPRPLRSRSRSRAEPHHRGSGASRRSIETFTCLGVDEPAVSSAIGTCRNRSQLSTGSSWFRILSRTASGRDRGAFRRTGATIRPASRVPGAPVPVRMARLTLHQCDGEYVLDGGAELLGNPPVDGLDFGVELEAEIAPPAFDREALVLPRSVQQDFRRSQGRVLAHQVVGQRRPFDSGTRYAKPVGEEPKESPPPRPSFPQRTSSTRGPPVRRRYARRSRDRMA